MDVTTFPSWTSPESIAVAEAQAQSRLRNTVWGSFGDWAVRQVCLNRQAETHVKPLSILYTSPISEGRMEVTRRGSPAK